MRKMKCTKTGSIINVTKHIILINGWEYYVTDNVWDDDIVQCLVMGFEVELGDVSLSEIRPHQRSVEIDMNSVEPAVGWEWV